MIIERWKLRVAKYFLLNIKYDIITALVGLTLAYITFTSTQNLRLGLLESAASIFISLVLIIWFRVRERTFYYLPLRSKMSDDGWIGIGTFQYRKTEQSYLITDTEAGFIFSRCFDWTEYKLEFDFRVISKYLGVILRATNLSNYAMVQITEHGIRPHIRVNGGWKSWEADETGMKFRDQLSFDKWYKCVISLEGRTIVVKVQENGKTLFNREWDIPQGSIALMFKRGEEDPGLPIPFPINLEYGTFGFRNSTTEVALVRNLLAQKI